MGIRSIVLISSVKDGWVTSTGLVYYWTTGLNYWTHLNCKIQLVRRISAEQKLNFRIPQLLR